MQRWLLLLISATLMGAILFSHGLNSPFVLDDVNKIKDNPDLHNPNFDLHDFVYRYSPAKPANRNDPSRPLPYMLYWLCWQAGSGSTFPFLALNLLLHILTGLSVAMLFFQYQPQRTGLAVFAALWFISLPLNAGAVSYAYALNDILSSLIAMIIILLALRPGNSLVAISLLYICALASKQSVVVIPALIVAMDLFNNRAFKTRISFYGTLAFISVAYIVVRQLHLGGVGDLEAQLLIPRKIYTLAEGAVLWLYVAKFFVPWNLSIQHSVVPSPKWVSILGWIGLWLGVWLALLPVVRNSPKRKWFALPYLLFVLVLLPTSSLFPTADLFVERRAYLATALAIPLLTLGFAQFKFSKNILVTAAIGFLAILSIATYRQVSIKTTEVGLWEHVLSIYPRDTRAYLGLSYYYLRHGMYPEGEDALNRLLQIEPRNPDGLINIGALYHLNSNPKNDKQKALYYYGLAAQEKPNDAMIWMNMGLLFAEVGELAKAESAFMRSIEIQPKNWVNYFGLGQVYKMAGKKQLSEQYLEKAKELKH